MRTRVGRIMDGRVHRSRDGAEQHVGERRAIMAGKCKQDWKAARKGFTAMTALVLLPLLVTGPALSDNLSQMLYDVYDNNPDIKAAEAATDAQKAATKKARAALMPRIDATASHTLTKDRLKGGGTSRKRTSQYGISASQRLFSGFQNRNNLMKSRYEERAGLYRARDKERQILLEAVQAYMDVYAARRMITLRRKHVANLERQRRATRARIRAGELTRTDLSKTDALIYRAKASLEGALADLGGAIGRYERLAGYKPGELIYPQLPERHLPLSAEDAQQKALQMHPDLRAARDDIKAAEYGVKSARGAFLPTIDATADVNRNFASSHSEPNKAEGSFALRLSLPLFDGGARLADVQKARADHSQKKYISHGLAARIKADAKEHYLRHRAAKASLVQAKAEVKAARAVLRGIRIEEKAGQRSFLDILDAELALLDAQELEIYSQADSVVALYAYLAATGQLTVSGARQQHLYYDRQADDAFAEAERLARAKQHNAKMQTGKPMGTRKAGDPWSGLR